MPRVKPEKGQATPDDRWRAEEVAFRRKRAQLLRRFAGEFVALYGGKVVGHGTDDEELAGKMFAKFGDAPFYIAKVEEEPTVADLPSPELGP